MRNVLTIDNLNIFIFKTKKNRTERTQFMLSLTPFRSKSQDLTEFHAKIFARRVITECRRRNYAINFHSKWHWRELGNSVSALTYKEYKETTRDTHTYILHAAISGMH